MKLVTGFQAELIAAEPDLHQPIAFAIDERGRLWVAEAYGYPNRQPEGQGKDRIVILEDRDGDGVFETKKVFAEKLNLVSGLEVGFGGVWVGAAPYLLFIPDKNHDDIPDGPPQVLLDGWGFQDTHETLNSFTWGPDGWLYGCHGVFSKRASSAILVNAAGIFGPIALIRDADPEAWLQTVMIDAVAPFYTRNAFVGGMLDAGWGRIVNVTSAASLHPPGALNSAYGTAKVALNQLTRHLAAEIAGTGVTANVIHPGDVKTDMWADIRDRVAVMGAVAENYISWADWVEETGGDPPEKAVALMLHLTSDAGADINGEFCWVEDPLQAPIPSWDPPDRGAALDEGVTSLRAEDLVGTWRLLEWEARQEDGAVSRPFGDAPSGYVVYTRDAHMITTISRARTSSHRRRPAVGSRGGARSGVRLVRGLCRQLPHRGPRRHPPRGDEPLSRLGGHRTATPGRAERRQATRLTLSTDPTATSGKVLRSRLRWQRVRD